jgi:hypothetical protein
MSSVKAGSKNNIKYEVVGLRETERSGMELSMDMLMKVKGKRYYGLKPIGYEVEPLKID